MPNPLSGLTPALAAICEKGKVLPATGQALIDLVGPDQDETFDRLLTDADERNKPVELVLEPPPWKLYHPLNPRPRRDDHVFRYFLDGSSRTHFLGTVVERERSSPVQFAQVGAAAVYRQDDGRMLRAGAERRLILMLSKEHVSPELWEAVASRVQALPDLELRNSGEKDPVTDGVQVGEPRFRGAHKANWFMREAERDLAQDVLTKLPKGAWLVLDGGLGKDILTWPYLKKWVHPPLIGVCKSFSKEPCFKVGGGPGGKILNLYELLARLEHGCRTAVFGAEGGPLAVFVSRVKLTDYRPEEVEEGLKRIAGRFKEDQGAEDFLKGREFLRTCFSAQVLENLCKLRSAVLAEPQDTVRDFFLLGLLAILKNFSYAVRDGGWLRWQKRPVKAEEVLPSFLRQIYNMLEDINKSHAIDSDGTYEVYHADARYLDLSNLYSAVITSPPYPNRHDYSRIFTVELLFHFLNEFQLKEFRHHSFSSHVEARPRDYANKPVLPTSFRRLLDLLKQKGADRRVPRMLRGFMEDMYITMLSLRKLIQPEGKLAFIVGNVRYLGEMIEVDDLLSQLAQQAGFKWLTTWVVRYRGNSAQQMGRYGRQAAREGVVILEKSGK